MKVYAKIKPQKFELVLQKIFLEKFIIIFSAGVGRTGTFIALDQLIKKISKQSCVDVFGTVYRMRMQRSQMVQTLVSKVLITEL